jgi:membrane protein YdbS with pleckstrin-like domain
MIVAIWIVIASIVLVGSAFFAFQQGGEENLFAGSMAIVGVVVMLLTLLIYPATRARKSD